MHMLHVHVHVHVHFHMHMHMLHVHVHMHMHMHMCMCMYDQTLKICDPRVSKSGVIGPLLPGGRHTLRG